MFERYTESARRVVFFARYEASNFGSPCIDTPHLLLGLLQEDKLLFHRVQLKVDFETARQDVASRIKTGKPIPTSVDLPLSEQAKRALKYAAEEADRLNQRQVSTTHLLLGLVRDEKFAAAESLTQLGAHLDSMRKGLEVARDEAPSAKPRASIAHHRTVTGPDVIMVHGMKRNVEELHRNISRLKGFFWNRKSWKPRNLVINKNEKKFSFDLTLAKKSSEFALVKGGWKKDQCAICSWDLFESEDSSHGIGFTNARDWICTECHHRFIDIDFFSATYSDIT
jgi:ATP-dependent Clp protease ATP-binding subunit ClpA